MAVSPGETKSWWLSRCWRDLVCASLLFLGLACGAWGQTETRFFRIGTASTGGSFFEIGGVVAAAISSPVEGSACGQNRGCGVPGLVAVAQATQGSMENLRLINSKQLESGFAQASLATMAYSGKGVFADDAAMPRLRVIGSLFPEAVHIVVRSESTIRSVEDLAGKVVAVGEPESGTVVNARVLLTAAGFGEAGVTRKNLRPARAVEEMKAGALDAIIVAGSFPVPAIQELAGTLPIRLVPVTGNVADQLERTFGSAYARATIPAGSYRNVDTDTPTFGFYAQWIVDADADPDLIHDITRAVWSEGAGKLFAGINPIGKQIRLENALNGISVPLHPGAERFYRERGMDVDKLPRVEDRPKETSK